MNEAKQRVLYRLRAVERLNRDCRRNNGNHQNLCLNDIITHSTRVIFYVRRIGLYL